ncbi:hypothetical protein KBH77_00820 [Patescibacteria group bacterium]|nr:hypothetical protein [Patescibacteria group bacterium]
MKLKILKSFSKIEPILFEQNKLFVAIENKIFSTTDFCEHFKLDGILPFSLAEKTFWMNRLTKRLFRLSPRKMLLLDDGSRIIIARKGIFKAGSKEKIYRRTFSITRGSRPISLCKDEKGNVYFGEYFSNPERSEVYIYGSSDKGETWNIAYVFPKRSIRHIHGLFYDKYMKCIWITTGDYGEEPFIAVTDDSFKSIRKVYSNGQLSRVVQIIVKKDHLYYSTDTEIEHNFICKLSKKDFSLSKLQPVQGSCTEAGENEVGMFFATMVEPSKVNKSQYSHLWFSKDGNEWSEIAKFKKDIWNPKYFQFGTICLPQGIMPNSYLFFSGRALVNIDNCLIFSIINDDGNIKDIHK